MTTTTEAPFTIMDGHNYMSLKTFRKDGSAVATPVWFAREGDRIYVVTEESSYKVKRIRNNTDAEIAPCDVRGNLLGVDYTPVTARILPVEEEKAADERLNRKYGWQKKLFALVRLIRRGAWVYLEISPR